MAVTFPYDVFLSHSSKDTEVAREIAVRLRTDGLRVWFDDWEINLGDSVRAKIEEGLEQSRVLVLCMSAHAFGSDWTRLEAGTFRFRDPQNKERRFIPLRLDPAPIDRSLAHLLYINWFSRDLAQEYEKLLEACRPQAVPEAQSAEEQVAEYTVEIDSTDSIWDYAFSRDGKRALTAGQDKYVRLWDLETGRCLRTLEGHGAPVRCVAWSANLSHALSGGWGEDLRLWDVETGQCLRVLKARIGAAFSTRSVVWSADQRFALSSADSVQLWDVDRGLCLLVLEGHSGSVESVAWSVDQSRALSGGDDMTVRLWDLVAGRCLHILEGHTGSVLSVAWSDDQRFVLSGAEDRTVRVWDVETGRCLRVLEGHLGSVTSVAWSANQRHLLSGADTVRLWEVETGRCLSVLRGHGKSGVRRVAWSSDQRRSFSGDFYHTVQVWDLSQFSPRMRASEAAMASLSPMPRQVQYTNAKVLLVGESGAGKTGLSKRLASNDWQPSDSTIGAWATQWKLTVPAGEGGSDGVEREIWLWDFGGQADQRLIHQLYMDDTAVAVLVFDGQKEDLFETLGQWDRDLSRASRQQFSKLLVAGRVDAGGLRVSRAQLEAFRNERGYLRLLETSAKANLGCEELKLAILDSIRWEDIPWRSSPLLFKRLREEIVRLKDAGQVLMRFNELRETLQLRFLQEGIDEVARFTDEELKAVVGLLASPGVVWELKFGSWVLLQPERINAYAQAVIQTMRADEYERGCLQEERVLSGDLAYHSSMPRLAANDERFVLLAMHQTLVERGLCLREYTDKGTLLIFPSYYRRERPELVGHPAVLVSYRFNGFLDDVYATLVVRLHHTKPFTQDQLWRYAADFKTLTGRQLGVKVTRRGEGAAVLEVYFDPVIPMEEKIIFSKYVHEHLLHSATAVVRFRHYVCPHCGTTVGNRDVAMERLDEWLKKRPAATGTFKSWRGEAKAPTIICSRCENRVPLWDEMEQSFASLEVQQQVRDLQTQSAVVLDSESKERVLVGEVISTVALAGQICREKSVSDHGIDMEIEFKDDNHEATGRMVLLQLKSGDSYLRKRLKDGAETFKIKDERHARYWMAQEFPVLLVIRNAEGEIRWMEVRDWLRRETDEGKKRLQQIVFQGERFDVMSVRGWREKVLQQGSPKSDCG